jgi:hypothetical protein
MFLENKKIILLDDNSMPFLSTYYHAHSILHRYTLARNNVIYMNVSGSNFSVDEIVKHMKE